MRLEAYIDALTELTTKRPELLDAKVVFAVDDEGNRFEPVHYSPSVGYHDSFDFCEEGSEDWEYEEEDSDGSEWFKVNSVCIN